MKSYMKLIFQFCIITIIISYYGLSYGIPTGYPILMPNEINKFRVDSYEKFFYQGATYGLNFNQSTWQWEYVANTNGTGPSPEGDDRAWGIFKVASIEKDGDPSQTVFVDGEDPGEMTGYFGPITVQSAEIDESVTNFNYVKLDITYYMEQDPTIPNFFLYWQDPALVPWDPNSMSSFTEANANTVLSPPNGDNVLLAVGQYKSLITTFTLNRITGERSH